MKNIFAHKRHTSSGVYLTDLQSSNNSDQQRRLRQQRKQSKSTMKKMDAEDPIGPELMIKENAADEAMGTYHSISPWVNSH